LARFIRTNPESVAHRGAMNSGSGRYYEVVGWASPTNVCIKGHMNHKIMNDDLEI
jgi:hypothetical protein